MDLKWIAQPCLPLKHKNKTELLLYRHHFYRIVRILFIVSRVCEFGNNWREVPRILLFNHIPCSWLSNRRATTRTRGFSPIVRVNPTVGRIDSNGECMISSEIASFQPIKLTLRVMREITLENPLQTLCNMQFIVGRCRYLILILYYKLQAFVLSI